MYNPFIAATQLQLAWLNGWVRANELALRHCEQMVRLQSEMLTHPCLHRHGDTPHFGATLTDHYGRRAHDVNVERI